MESAIADDVLVNRLLAGEPVPNQGGDKSALINDRPSTDTAFVQSFKGLVDHWVGYLVLVTHDFQDNGENVSRSAAVRVDNITEVIGVLEVLFKR